MLKSNSNPVLVQLRDTARILRLPQAVVAANWYRRGQFARPYSASRNIGITAAQYRAGRDLVARLARLEP